MKESVDRLGNMSKSENNVPAVIAQAFSKAKSTSAKLNASYQDGHGYDDGYWDAGYGDYGDSEDPDPNEE